MTQKTVRRYCGGGRGLLYRIRALNRTPPLSNTCRLHNETNLRAAPSVANRPMFFVHARGRSSRSIAQIEREANQRDDLG